MHRLADQVKKEDGTPISPQDLFDIEVHYQVPALHVLRELARVLHLDDDMLLAASGGADVVVREYLQRNPKAAAAVSGSFGRRSSGGSTVRISCASTSHGALRAVHRAVRKVEGLMLG